MSRRNARGKETKGEETLAEKSSKRPGVEFGQK